VWTFGIQLWGCTKPNNTAIIQRFQNKVLRNIVDAPWYVSNTDLHRDLKMEMVMAEIRRFTRKHEERLLHQDNAEVICLTIVCYSKGLKEQNRFSWYHEH